MSTYAVPGFYNLREAGELDVKDGKIRSQAFLRSDQPRTLDESGVAFFTDLALSQVVDLRDQEEVSHQPSVFSARGFTDSWVPIFAGSASSFAFNPPSVTELYAQMITESGQALTSAVKQISLGLDQGAVLVHCTAGKDRTGVVVALVQELLGASREGIVENYRQSQQNLEGPWAQAQLAAYEKIFGQSLEAFVPLMVSSPPEAMMSTLQLVDEQFGGVEAYLSANGMGSDEMEQLKEKLVVS